MIEGDDSGFKYTEIMGDGSDGDVEGDILGELLGEVDGDDSGAYGLVGAASAKSRQNSQKRAMARDLMARRVRSGALLRSVPPRNAREYALGLGSTSVAGSSWPTSTCSPR